MPDACLCVLMWNNTQYIFGLHERSLTNLSMIYLLEHINHDIKRTSSWTTGKFPESCYYIYIPKPGKDPAEPINCKPIA